MSMLSTYGSPNFDLSREDFCGWCHLLYTRHLVTGVGGNVSARSGNRILMTPTGISLRALAPEEISVLDAEGRLVEGALPSKEANFHIKILQTRSDINVVLHLHGSKVIAASNLLIPGPDTLPPLTPGFVYYAYPLSMIPFQPPGSVKLSESIFTELSRHNSLAVLLQNHGFVTVGKNFSEALNVAEEIEEAAHVYILTRGKGTRISDTDIAAIKSL